jgi:carbon-monoxide dehydrogenase medium subunit
MKAAPFEYARPETVGEAVDVLTEHGEEAKLLAGGQSLVPLLALRFAQPRLLVDLNGVDELSGIRALDDGGVAIGAMTRTRALETDPLVRDRLPLAHEAAPLIAHRAIRNRGTVGGSLAHADAAAEMPAVLVALRGTVTARGPAGVRKLAAGDLFRGHYTTALKPDEVLTEVRLPPLGPNTGTAFVEHVRRHGDFAIVGAGVTLTLEQGRCTDATIAVIGVADRPFAADAAVAALVGQDFGEGAAHAAGVGAAAALTPTSDIHASGAYRKHLTEVLVRRALLLAARRAVG